MIVHSLHIHFPPHFKSGRAPFNAKKAGKNAMFRAIRAGDYVFYDDYWSDISINAKKLVLSMLHVDPSARLTAKEALNTEWILTKDEDLRRFSLDKSLAEIISFNARRKLKGAIGAVMVAVGGKFWNIETSAFAREDMHGSETAVDGSCRSCEADSAPPTFDGLYHLDTKLQEGVQATVWQGTSVETEKTYAIKVVEREGLTLAEDASVLNEVSILKSLRHKHIVPLLDFFETPECFYLVMEKCNGGDVLDRVAEIEQYSEKDACQLSRGLLQAVQFMHARGIAHRDLKVSFQHIFSWLFVLFGSSHFMSPIWCFLCVTAPAPKSVARGKRIPLIILMYILFIALSSNKLIYNRIYILTE